MITQSDGKGVETNGVKYCQKDQSRLVLQNDDIEHDIVINLML